MGAPLGGLFLIWFHIGGHQAVIALWSVCMLNARMLAICGLFLADMTWVPSGDGNAIAAYSVAAALVVAGSRFDELWLGIG